LDQHVEPYIGPACISLTVMSFSPDGQLIAAAGHALVTRVWNTQTGAIQTLRHGRSAATSPVGSLAFSTDGKFMASMRTGDVAIWRVADWQRVNLDGAPSWSYGEMVSFSQGRGDLIGAVTGYGLSVWSTDTGKRLNTMSLSGTTFTRNLTL